MVVAKRLGQDARSDEPVRERVTRARGNLRAVRDHPPLAVGRTREVGGVEVQEPATGRFAAVRRPQEIRLREHQRGRQPLRADQLLRAIGIGEDAVEERGALDEAGLQPPPFFRADDEGQRVELPRTFHAALIAIDVVGDAALVDEAARGLPASLDLAFAQLGKRFEQQPVVRPHRAAGVEQFIVQPGRRTVAGEQSRVGTRDVPWWSYRSSPPRFYRNGRHAASIVVSDGSNMRRKPDMKLGAGASLRLILNRIGCQRLSGVQGADQPAMTLLLCRLDAVTP